MPASEPIGEERRVALLNRLTETLGEEEARTLMEGLPQSSGPTWPPKTTCWPAKNASAPSSTANSPC